jgi:hypothetical protein
MGMADYTEPVGRAFARPGGSSALPGYLPLTLHGVVFNIFGLGPLKPASAPTHTP